MQIESKTVMSWSLQKKNRAFFVPLSLSKGSFFNICVLSQFIVYRIHFQNIHNFTYQKTFYTLFCLVFKIVESLQCILKVVLTIIEHGHTILKTFIQFKRAKKLYFTHSSIYLSLHFLTDCMYLSCHIRVSEWIYTL